MKHCSIYLTTMIICLACCTTVFSQRKLHVSLVGHEEGVNDPLVPMFDSLVQYVKEKDNQFDFSGVIVRQSSFVGENEVRKSTIGTMKAGEFVRCLKELGDDALKPIFIVKKQNQDLPYFSSFFIASINSSINSLDPQKNIKVYFVDERSVSGYISPMNRLYEMGLIDFPKLPSFKSSNWTAHFADSHPNVARMVADDPNAIGALSELPSDMSGLKILLRHDLIPQDVFFISQDLVRFEEPIRQWLLSDSTILPTLAKSSTKITGLVPFETEHAIAYQALRKNIDRVTGEGEIDTFNFDSPFDVFTSVMKMNWKTQGLLATFIAMIFSTGVLMATRFPNVLRALRGEKLDQGDMADKNKTEVENTV